MSFLHVAPRLDPGGRLTMTLGVDDSGVNHAVGDAEIVVCAVTEAWETGSPMAWDSQPRRGCEGASEGVYQPATNDFFFDLTELLPVLATTGWHGVVVAPDPATTAPVFQVVFRSAVEGSAAIDYQAPPEDSAPTGDGMAPPSPPPAEDAGASFEIDPLPKATSAEPNSGASSTNETEAAAPATAAEPLEDVFRSPQERQASFVAFYAGMAALAMLLTARPVVAAASGLLRAGTGHEATGLASRARGGRHRR